MPISRHPGPERRSSPDLRGEADVRRAFRSIRLPTVSPADPRSELGPRSLDPVRSFWSAFAELIRGQPSPTDFCNCTTTCGQPNPDSRSSQGRRPRSPPFSSSCHAASRSPFRGESGDTRRAALRPSAETPVPVPPACAGLPDRDASSNAPPPKLAPRSIVRIDVHGSKDRAKDAVPFAHATISRACAGCMRLVAHADGVPLLGDLRTSAVTGLAPAAGRYPPRTPRPSRPPFRRRPAKSAAFPETGMSFTVTPREGSCVTRGGIAPSGLRAGSPAHAAHTLSPRWGECS
jgi:hypothetical protein